MSRIVAIVGFGLLVGCVHTPPHPPVEGTWSREFTRRQELRRDGRYCAWEAESPAWSGTLLWPAEAPIGDNWCETDGETARWFDVVGQDGVYENGAQVVGAGFEHDDIVEPGGEQIADGEVGNGIGPLPRFVRGALIDPQQAQQIGPGAFEPAQVIGVIDHPRQVRIVKIGAHRKAVDRPIEAAFRRPGRERWGG